MTRKVISVFTLVFMLAATAAFAHAAGPGLTSKDRKFIKDAARYGLFEVRLGEMAQERGESKGVRDFGSLMVKDHLKENAELKRIAKKKDVTVSERLDARDKKTIDRLLKLTGSDFDYEYTKAMVKDHKKNAVLFKRAIREVSDPELRKFALKTYQHIEGDLKQGEYLSRKFREKRSW